MCTCSGASLCCTCMSFVCTHRCCCQIPAQPLRALQGQNTPAVLVAGGHRQLRQRAQSSLARSSCRVHSVSVLCRGTVKIKLRFIDHHSWKQTHHRDHLSLGSAAALHPTECLCWSVSACAHALRKSALRPGLLPAGQSKVEQEKEAREFKRKVQLHCKTQTHAAQSANSRRDRKKTARVATIRSAQTRAREDR